MGIGQIFFLIILVVVGYNVVKQYSKIYRNIKLGKDEKIEGDSGQRLKNLVLIAFGQKKMFKRPIPALMHLFIYVAFLFTQIELIEIMIDGIFGVHRFFAPYLGILYTLIINSIEILSLLALVGTFVFFWRRNMIKLPRLHMPEMKGWPTMDANMILLLEFILIVAIFTMNGADVVLQKLDPAHYPDTGTLAISSFMGPMMLDWAGKDLLVVLERAGWWLHIIVVFVFLNYLPKSKHLHIMLAFPNVYFAKTSSRGEIENMPAIMDEVKSMMGLTEGGEELPMSEEIPEFGAKDVMGLSWKNIMDAYTCTECGRCSSVCPANITGKKLSPRKIMMDIRDRAEEIGNNIDSGDSLYFKEGAVQDGRPVTRDTYDDGKSLFDYITKEEIHACTTCNACVEACPVMINPLDPILALRRYEILTESTGPADWLPMFTSLENSGAVWQIPDEREKWIHELEN